ncbi:MAG: hypothetical protein WEB00_14750 [Dehalococcoidia bacterium]
MVNVTVPAGRQAIILARFSAESFCSAPAEYCYVEILIGDSVAEPDTGDAAFDSASTSYYSSSSIERFRSVGPGSYAVRVRYWVFNGNGLFHIDDSLLTAEVILK